MNAYNLRNKTLFWQKIALIIFGVFLSLVLLEGALRLGEYIFIFMQEYRNVLSIKKEGSAYRILCLGESMVAMGGNNSYPSQLENILNQNNIGLKFSIINKGIPGGTSTLLLKQLEKNIRQYKPRMVVAMMGINDWGDIFFYKDRPSLRKNFLHNLKIFNLIKFVKLYIINKDDGMGVNNIISAGESSSLFTDNLVKVANKESLGKHKISQNSIEAYVLPGWDYSFQGNYKQSEEMFQEAIKIDPNCSDAYRGLACCYKVAKRWDEAEKMFKKAIEVDPGLSRGYEDLAKYYIEIGLRGKNDNKIREAEILFKKAIELDAENDKAYGGLGICYRIIGEYKLADEYFKKANRSRNQFYTMVTVKNYLALKTSLDRHGIKLVVATYPMRGVGPLKKIFTGQKGIIFIDNEKIFKDALQKASYDEYFFDAFAGDFGHGTIKGNRLLAENTASAILKEVFGK